MPLPVSIVTVSFNQARFLSECLASVVAQKRRDLDQYVVVDPGSSDGSRDILSRRAADIDQLILEPDEGPADGLNKGFAHATGELIAYINSDDRLAPGAIDYASRYMEAHPAVDVLCGAIAIIDERGRPAPRRIVSDVFDIPRYVAGVCTIGQQATFIRRTAFERTRGFNRANRVSWDGELLVDLALTGARFAASSRVLGEWRIYPGTITRSATHRLRLSHETARIASRVAASGIRLYPPARVRALQLLYRWNLFRHMRYLLAR